MKSLSCPNRHCHSSGKGDVGAIIRHGFWGKRRRYQCQTCGKTFCSTTQTPYYRLQHRRATFDEVASLSVEGLNKSAIARVKRVAWNTVHRWLEKAAGCCRRFSHRKSETSGKAGGLILWTAQSGMFLWATQSGGLFEHRELVDSLVFLFLFLDVLADLLLISTHSRYIVPTSPKMFSHEVPAFAHVTSNVNGTFPFHKPDDLRHWVLRRYRHQHVNMVTHQMSFLNATFLTFDQLSNDTPQMSPQGTIEYLPATFRDKDNVVFAFPLGMF
jgi:transposase-like protein